MICLVSQENRRDFQTVCGLDPVFGTQIWSDYCAYGNRYPFQSSWLGYSGDKPAAAIGRYYGGLRACGSPEADKEELFAFIEAQAGEDGKVEASQPLAGEFAAWVKRPLEISCLMEFKGETAGKGKIPVRREDSPWVAYKLLCLGSGLFRVPAVRDRWICDVSHRQRRGQCILFAADGPHGPVATAGIYYMSDTYAVISSVVTLPEYRGMGYGSSLTLACVRAALKMGGIPVLACAEMGLAAFYQGLGFTSLRDWGRIRFEMTDGKGF